MDLPLKINIDASSLSACGCVLHWYRVVAQGYREKVQSASMVYGTSVHKFIDTMYKTKGDIKIARDEAYKSYDKPKYAGKSSQHLLDKGHLLATCLMVWEDHIMKDESFDVLQLPDGKPATEITFSFPYYKDDFLDIHLEGTVDRLGKIRNGIFCFRDWKTTSKFNVKDYLDPYKLSKQLRFYRLAFRLMAEREPESVLGRIGKSNLGACIDGIFLKPRATDNEYHSSPVYTFKDDTITEFQQLLDTYIQRLSKAVEMQHFPREGIVNGSCFAAYDCKFIPVCGAAKEFQQTMLDRDYAKTPYEPLKFGEIK